MSKSNIKLNQMQINSTKPLLVDFDHINKAWNIKVSYPDTNSLAGTSLVFNADGSVNELTFDEEGQIINETQIRSRKRNA